MTDRPDVSPWRKLIGITILSSLIVPQASVLSQDIDPATAVAADPLRLAAEDTASCRELRDPDVRLACFDAAAHRLSEALGSRDQVVRNAGDLPISTDATNASAAPAAVEPSVRATKQLPDWAAAPQRQRKRRAQRATALPARLRPYKLPPRSGAGWPERPPGSATDCGPAQPRATPTRKTGT